VSDKKLFISHAVADESLVNKFVDWLDVACGVPRDQIFCTSCPDMGVVPGKDFIQFIKSEIENASVIIPLLSPNYYASVFCLGELGATWVLDDKIFILPILVPPMNYSSAKATLAVTHMGMIDDKNYLGLSTEYIVQHHELPKPKIVTWDIKTDQFLEGLPSVLSALPKPNIVPTTEFTLLQDKYQESVNLLKQNEEEIKHLEDLIEELKEAKDKDEVRKIILAHLGEEEQFEALISEVRQALSSFPTIVQEAFFYDFTGDIFSPDDHPFGDLDKARKASHDGYLYPDPDFNGFHLDTSLRDVKVAHQKIKALTEFLKSSDLSDEFIDYFYEEYGYNAYDSLERKAFWDRRLI
jgi:hypothetical protein